MNEKEWQRGKRKDIALMVVGLVGTLLGSVLIYYLWYSAMWDPQLLEVLRSLSPSSRSIFLVESLKSATRNFEKLMDILEFLLTHDLKFASTNFYIENGHVERRIKPLRAGHTSKEIQKNLSQTAGLGYRHAAALNQL